MRVNFAKMGDHLVYEDAVSTELYTTSEFTAKQYLYVNDNNNGSYSSQIVLDTTSLSNSGMWIGWSEAFILMPLVLQFESATMTTGTCYDWAVGLKNGYWNMIHAMTVEFNNRNVVQQVPFLNVFSSFRAMTSWSHADVQNWGAICGFYPDTPDSWVYNNLAGGAAGGAQTSNILCSSGMGLSNCRNCEYITITNFLDLYNSANNDVSTGAGGGAVGAIPASFNFTTKCTVPNSAIRQHFNCGLQKRQSWINFNAATTASGALPSIANAAGYVQTYNTTPATSGRIGSFTLQGVNSNQAVLLNAGGATYSAMFQAQIAEANGGAARVITIPAVIRLKDICSFFEKIPLLKGSTMRIYLNTNQCFFTAEYIGGQLANTTPVQATPAVGTVIEQNYSFIGLTTAPYILGGGATNPIMLASNDIGQGGYTLSPYTAQYTTNNAQNRTAPAVVSVNVGVSIARNQFTQFTYQAAQAPITQCRLYAPAFNMNPLAETRFLELTPTKKVLYNDIFQFYFPAQGAGANINILVSNGIPNIKQVVVVPLLSASGTTPTNGVAQQYVWAGPAGGATTALGSITQTPSTLLSPFSTTGATPDPILLDNFQILISGVNLFIQQFQYGFEDFYEQVVSVNQLNGSLTTGLGSGLIGYKEWQYLYRYYVGNASRIIPSEEGMARSVQVQCQNLCSQSIDLMVFVEYEKSITVNMATGQEIA